MFVCLCSGVTEKDIIEAVEAGDSNLEALSMKLGVGMQCGSCISYTQELIANHGQSDLQTGKINQTQSYNPEADAAVFYQVA